MPILIIFFNQFNWIALQWIKHILLKIYIFLFYYIALQKNIIFYLKMYFILLYGFALQYVDSGTWWHGKIIVSNLLLVFRKNIFI